MRRQFPQEQTSWLEDVFAGLSEAEAGKLREAGTLRVLEEGDLVDDFSESIIRVESGLVKLAVSSEDRSLAVALFGPGDTICAPLYHSWESDLYFIQAQEQTEIRVIPQAAVLKASAANPEFANSVMRQLSWAAWQFMNTISMLSFYNLPQRVSQVLVNLAAMFGRSDDKGGIRLGLRLTQEELAELAGARRETLSTVLQDFREDDILDLRYARIDIKDFDALQKLAGTEPMPFLKKSEALAK
jgi:CRP/FNR family transcriptional regulator, cyclic AMP receptor protein